LKTDEHVSLFHVKKESTFYSYEACTFHRVLISIQILIALNTAHDMCRNIVAGGSSILARSGFEKSNAELVSSLRTNFSTHREAASQASTTLSSASNNFTAWTTQQEKTLFIPTRDISQGLSDQRAAYDITVKLFYLPNVPPSRRCSQTREAVELVLRALNVTSVDLLIVSYPGITFDADDEDSDSELEPPENMTNGIHDEPEPGESESTATMIASWRVLEELASAGKISRLGLAEFGSNRLARFLAQTQVRPSVDQINVRDCCIVPKPLILYAKQEGIELLTHNDCTNILPRGTLRDLLGPSKTGFSILPDKGEDSTTGLSGDIEPQFVVKYTAVVKETGRVENKGYFAIAELMPS
jgi:glutamate--cysteine ligase regulatory subunit